jgi:parvulin-like peptidyl-prolyl isomerase
VRSLGFSLSLVLRGARVVGVAATLIAAVLAAAPGAIAQTPGPAGAVDERERAFVEGLRREDPGDADRYVALRDARNQAIAEIQKVQARYSAAGPELRPLFVQQLRDAQRQYAERSLALLDFLDARERRALIRYQEEINRINRLLEERARSRADLERLMRGE